MDRKEMRDDTRMKGPESRTRKHRVRSYKSLIINLVALVGLFALVFALQQLGTRHAEKTVNTEPTKQVTEVAAKKVTLQKQAPAAAPAGPVQEKSVEKIKNQEVAMVVIQTTEEGAAKPKAEAKIILKPKKTSNSAKARRTSRNRVYREQAYREDRLRSAALVDMLDGKHSNQYSGNTQNSYRATNAQQPTYTPARDSYSGRTDRMNSAELVDMLDGRASQPATKGTNRFNWANEVPMASTQHSSGIEETTLTSGSRGYATADPQDKPTYVAPGRRPAWDVNAGSPR